MCFSQLRVLAAWMISCNVLMISYVLLVCSFRTYRSYQWWLVYDQDCSDAFYSCLYIIRNCLTNFSWVYAIFRFIFVLPQENNLWRLYFRSCDVNWWILFSIFVFRYWCLKVALLFMGMLVLVRIFFLSDIFPLKNHQV